MLEIIDSEDFSLSAIEAQYRKKWDTVLEGLAKFIFQCGQEVPSHVSIKLKQLNDYHKFVCEGYDCTKTIFTALIREGRGEDPQLFMEVMRLSWLIYLAIGGIVDLPPLLQLLNVPLTEPEHKFCANIIDQDWTRNYPIIREKLFFRIGLTQSESSEQEFLQIITSKRIPLSLGDQIRLAPLPWPVNVDIVGRRLADNLVALEKHFDDNLYRSFSQLDPRKLLPRVIATPRRMAVLAAANGRSAKRNLKAAFARASVFHQSMPATPLTAKLLSTPKSTSGLPKQEAREQLVSYLKANATNNQLLFGSLPAHDAEKIERETCAFLAKIANENPVDNTAWELFTPLYTNRAGLPSSWINNFKDVYCFLLMT
ncbi:hypothetical protein HDU97_000654 [Phlyctochytrium planicorne]|nr:hypothetical protein HDU97_000654 [Phlyctochytrium planicorne]